MKTVVIRLLLLSVGFFWLPTITMGTIISVVNFDPFMFAIMGAPMAIYIWFSVDTVKQLNKVKNEKGS